MQRLTRDSQKSCWGALRCVVAIYLVSMYSMPLTQAQEVPAAQGDFLRLEGLEYFPEDARFDVVKIPQQRQICTAEEERLGDLFKGSPDLNHADMVKLFKRMQASPGTRFKDVDVSLDDLVRVSQGCSNVIGVGKFDFYKNYWGNTVDGLVLCGRKVVSDFSGARTEKLKHTSDLYYQLIVMPLKERERCVARVHFYADKTKKEIRRGMAFKVTCTINGEERDMNEVDHPISMYAMSCFNSKF